MSIDVVRAPLVYAAVNPAEVIGLSPENAAQLQHRERHELGPILLGNNQLMAERFHTGPINTEYRPINKGGQKWKPYVEKAYYDADGEGHGDAMFEKTGVIGETDYSGGKTIVNVNPRILSHEQGKSIMGQTALAMRRLGLADPFVDVPAADEGSAPYIQYYAEALIADGMPPLEAYATITGKPGMISRPPITGIGGAAVHRADMELRGTTSETVAVQGFGFAGGYYAAEAARPRATDASRFIGVQAVGEVDFSDPTNPRHYTLFTHSPEGLPITPDMVDSMLLHPDQDTELRAAKGNKLKALAAKIDPNRADHSLDLVAQSVLDFEADTMMLAATSNVVDEAVAARMNVQTIRPIANLAATQGGQQVLADRGIRYQPPEVVGAGGLAGSLQEHRLDLRRLQGEQATENVAQVWEKVVNTLGRANRQVTTLARERSISEVDAMRCVALAQHALRHNMTIDPSVQHILAIA